MASKMIGRAACPECGFGSAHVKESEKCLYRYCPECNSQHYAKSARQRADLMQKTRLIDGGSPTGSSEAAAQATPTATTDSGSGTDTTATPTTHTTPQAMPAKRRGLFA